MATMFICSINTILFNANPLLRYDGYYVMADWLEIPNLRIKSTQFFAYLIQEKVLGLEIPVQSYMPRSRRILFVTYAIASYLYRWVVTFSIIYFLSQVLKPYKLQIDQLHAGERLAGAAGWECRVYQIFKFLRTPGRMRKVKKARAAGFAVAAVAIVAGDSPDPDAAADPGNPGADGGQARRDLRRGRGTARRAQRPRRRVGQEGHGHRHAHQPREAEGAGPEAGRTRRSTCTRPSGTTRAPSARTAPMAASTSRWPRSSSRCIEKINEQIGKLTLVAHRDGQVIGVPHPETVGQWLKPGKPFCEVGDPHQLEAHLILDQRDIDLIRAGSPRLGQDLRRVRDDLEERGQRDRQAEPRRDPARALQHGRRRDRRQARPQDRARQAPSPPSTR